MDMVKFIAKTKDKNSLPLLGLGICEENAERLVKGQPLVVYGEQVQTNFNVIIVYGETNESLLASLKLIIPNKQGIIVFMGEGLNGFPWFGIGINKEEMRELKKEGSFVKFEGEKYGISHDVILFYQETMDDLALVVRELIGDDTIVTER